MTQENKPTNGWDALVKIIEMILTCIIGMLALLLLTPFGWIAILILALTGILHALPPIH